jgi:uncharacterized protein (DUF302 family)
MGVKRYWMTGCMALILVAAGRWPQDDQDDATGRAQRSWVTLTSKYDVDETVRKIERVVRGNGLPVLARADAVRPAGPMAAGGEAPVHVLVLGDDAGHTPIVQAEADAPPELPWRVLVRKRDDGLTEVGFERVNADTLPEELTAETVARVNALPKVLAAAVT